MPIRTRQSQPFDLSILVLPESGSMAASGLNEVLGDTARNSDVLSRPIRPALVAASRGPFSGSTGLTVTPERDLCAPLADIVIVIDIRLAPDDSPESRWRTEMVWLHRHVEAGALVCSTCSGAVLLAEAGLLDGGDAASHWSMAALFRDRYPRVNFRPERILCSSGRDGQLVTTGGASSWQDLALYLIARFCGAEEAARIAHLFLLGDRGYGQPPFSSMVRPRQHGDPVIAATQEWLIDNCAMQNPVAAMVTRSGLAERTFKWRFWAATGYKPIEYVQALRIEEAKQMLEREDIPLDEIAALVGYEDPTFFRRLFKRRAGVTPSRYRQRNRFSTSLG